MGFNMKGRRQAWWHAPMIPLLKRLRQEDERMTRSKARQSINTGRKPSALTLMVTRSGHSHAFDIHHTSSIFTIPFPWKGFRWGLKQPRLTSNFLCS